MMRRTILFSVVVLMLVAPLAGGASAVPPQRGCPPAFDLGYTYGDQDGKLTFQEELTLPQVVAGIDAGLYDEETLAAGFALVNKNGDEYICGQSLPAALPYFFNAIDNTAPFPR